MNKYAWMVLAGACSYGLLSTFVKLSFRWGFFPAQVSFVQAFLGLIVLLAIYYFNKRENKSLKLLANGWKENIQLLLTGSFIGLTTYFYYLSVLYIPASLAIVILMQFTWIGIALDCIISFKRPRTIEVISTMIVLLGTSLAVGFKDAFEETGKVEGILFALLSSLFYALFILGNTQYGKSFQPLEKSIIIMAGSTSSILVFNIRSLAASHLLDSELLYWGILLALFGTIIPPVLFARGIPKVGVGVSSILMTAELPVAIICSSTILGEKVSGLQWVGVLLILSAIIYLKLRRHKKLDAVI